MEETLPRQPEESRRYLDELRKEIEDLKKEIKEREDLIKGAEDLRKKIEDLRNEINELEISLYRCALYYHLGESDCTIIARGRKFHLHRKVLERQSPCFQRALGPDWKTKHDISVDEDPNIFVALTQCIYPHLIPHPSEDRTIELPMDFQRTGGLEYALKLYLAGMKYGVDLLQTVALWKLQEDFRRVWLFSEFPSVLETIYGNPGLRSSARTVAVRQILARNFRHCESILRLSPEMRFWKDHPDLQCDVLRWGETPE